MTTPPSGMDMEREVHDEGLASRGRCDMKEADGEVKALHSGDSASMKEEKDFILVG